MNIIEAMKQLRDDLKLWVAYNLKEKVDKDGDKVLSTNDFSNEHKSKLENLGDIIEDENGDMTVADENGNIIFKIDAGGVHTTGLTVNGELIEAGGNVDVFKPATDTKAGEEGLVPAPSIVEMLGDMRFLSDHAEWVRLDTTKIADAMDSGRNLFNVLVEMQSSILSETQIQTMIDESIANIAIYEGEAEDIPLTITFSIEGTSYTADRGMTWAEWIESDYNTAGISTYTTDKQSSSVVATYVVNSDAIILVQGTANQYATHTIVANANYTPVERYSFVVNNFNYTAEAGMTWYEWINSGDAGSELFACESESSSVDSGALIVYLGDGTGLISSSLLVIGKHPIIPYGIYNTAEEIVDGGVA
jgi:hypothetical protein